MHIVSAGNDFANYRSKKSGVRPLSKQLCITCEAEKDDAIKLGLQDYSIQIKSNIKIDSPTLQKKFLKEER